MKEICFFLTCNREASTYSRRINLINKVYFCSKECRNRFKEQELCFYCRYCYSIEDKCFDQHFSDKTVLRLLDMIQLPLSDKERDNAERCINHFIRHIKTYSAEFNISELECRVNEYNNCYYLTFQISKNDIDYCYLIN